SLGTGEASPGGEGRVAHLPPAQPAPSAKRTIATKPGRRDKISFIHCLGCSGVFGRAPRNSSTNVDTDLISVLPLHSCGPLRQKIPPALFSPHRAPRPCADSPR